MLEFTPMIKESGSVRVDLLGGTLDLVPINLILPNVTTINVATSLKAEVEILEGDKNEVKIISEDYSKTVTYKSEDFTNEKLLGNYFEAFTLVVQILDYFEVHGGVILKLSSGSPPGAGLGGSSTMGMTLYKALCRYKGIELERARAIDVVRGVEGRILNSGPAGYQDFYPAVYGGVLCLEARLGGIEVNQLYNEDLKKYLETHVALIYSGKTRLSGINNWEVYKAFFDGNIEVREGLSEIASLSSQAKEAIVSKDYGKLLSLISREGECREKLFSNIVTDEMSTLFKELRGKGLNIGMKVCGAGGGGCFLVTFPNKEDRIVVENFANKLEMSVLDFVVEAPL